MRSGEGLSEQTGTTALLVPAVYVNAVRFWQSANVKIWGKRQEHRLLVMMKFKHEAPDHGTSQRYSITLDVYFFELVLSQWGQAKQT